MSQVVYWQDYKQVESSGRKRRKYRVVCSDCSHERYLTRWHAKKALERNACRACVSRENGKKSYQILADRYGKDFARRQLHKHKLATPTSLERQAMSVLDNLGYDYEREFIISLPTLDGELWYDFALHDLTTKTVLVEVDGEYHHRDTACHDAFKRRVAERQGYLFLRVAESDVDMLDEILERFLSNSLALIL